MTPQDFSQDASSTLIFGGLDGPDAGRRSHPSLVVVQLLGANVRHHRKLKGISQERLALDAGMERSYVSDLERGTRNPSVRAVGRRAHALEIEPKLLLELPVDGPSI